jgi:hypothetical protein
LRWYLKNVKQTSNDSLALRQNAERPNVERPNVKRPNVECCKNGQMSNGKTPNGRMSNMAKCRTPNVERQNFTTLDPCKNSTYYT